MIIKNTTHTYTQKFIILILSIVLIFIHLIILFYFIHVNNLKFEETIKLKLERIKIGQEELLFMQNIKSNLDMIRDKLLEKNLIKLK